LRRGTGSVYLGRSRGRAAQARALGARAQGVLLRAHTEPYHGAWAPHAVSHFRPSLPTFAQRLTASAAPSLCAPSAARAGALRAGPTHSRSLAWFWGDAVARWVLECPGTWRCAPCLTLCAAAPPGRGSAGQRGLSARAAGLLTVHCAPWPFTTPLPPSLHSPQAPPLRLLCLCLFSWHWPSLPPCCRKWPAPLCAAARAALGAPLAPWPPRATAGRRGRCPARGSGGGGARAWVPVCVRGAI